jgi:hypothetical protein
MITQTPLIVPSGDSFWQLTSRELLAQLDGFWSRFQFTEPHLAL